MRPPPRVAQFWADAVADRPNGGAVLSDRTVTARFEGPGVENGVVPLDDLLAVLGRLQSAVRRMAEDLAGRTPKPGRLPDAIRSAGSLALVGTRRGSFVAEIALAEPRASALPDFGVDALDRVIGGMEHPESLPPRVAREIADLASSLRDGIDAVRFEGGASNGRAVLRRIEKVQEPKTEPVRVQRTIYGRILEVDWKDGTAELHTTTGMVRVSFDTSRSEELRRFATQHVAVLGSAELSDTHDVRLLELETIEPTIADDSFWLPPTPDDFIRESGVAPYTFPDPSEVDDPDDVEAFLDAIFGERGAT